ncbi:MAG: SpoIID/LytB domain-containing protein [Acidobacteria bacterium]|nr:SpoIID/LytB domain-containing protein [Acidobacteriota bacterium]MBS1866832.1 SpoIID/LytB domain-containing protein [Acidobacteriota bacterium]
MRCLCIAFFLFALPLSAQTLPHTVRIGVLGIFHSRQLTLAVSANSPLLAIANGHRFFLQPRSACSSLSIRKETKLLISGCGKEIEADNLRATSRNQQATSFILTVPGKLSRRYEGILEIKTRNNELVPVITMDLELAVASTVQAETTSGTPLEALKAQAVVSRSYLFANLGRHKNFDFCDLTHCQVLREPPSSGSPAAQAAAATQGLILTFEGRPVATMFTRSCGGRTRTPQELGLPQAAYPYFSVACDACEKDPVRWTRALSEEDAALLPAMGENGRLAICRKLGWNSVPSNNFVARMENGKVVLEGTGQGDGIGLCQRGAAFLAAQSSDFHEILTHYFPKTKIEPLTPVTTAPSN